MEHRARRGDGDRRRGRPYTGEPVRGAKDAIRPSQLITLGTLVWLVIRLVDGASGWLGAAIPVVIVSGLTALGSAFTVAYDASELGRSIPTFAFDTYIADRDIERELAKHPVSGGSPDWNSFWLWRIAYATEHPPVDRPAGDYVDYIIAARAAAGLPPLKGIESATAPTDAARPQTGPKATVSGRFLVDGHDLGLASSTVIVRDGVLDVDLTAAAVVPARTCGSCRPTAASRNSVAAQRAAVQDRAMTPDEFFDAEVRPRTEPPGRAEEREMLLGFLRWQRETFAWKCVGLSPEQLASRAVAPSTMSLLGLIRHQADVERGWVQGRIAGEVSEPLYWRVDDNDADFNEAVGTPECVEQAWTAFWEAAAFTDRFVPAAPSLEITCEDRWRGTLSLRWVLLHLIDGYARHNGHADLLRERIDGAVGQ